jgi:Na+/proline symporter
MRVFLSYPGTVLFSVLIGVYYAFIQKQKTNSDLLVGGRNMSLIPVSLSLLATYVSATIILGEAAQTTSHACFPFLKDAEN